MKKQAFILAVTVIVLTGCKTAPGTLTFDKEAPLSKRFQQYEQQKIVQAPQIFANSLKIGETRYMALEINPLFQQKFVDQKTRDDFATGNQASAYGAILSLAGGVLGILSVFENENDRLPFYIGGAGSLAAGLVLIRIGNIKVNAAINSYNSSLAREIMPELATRDQASNYHQKILFTASF